MTTPYFPPTRTDSTDHGLQLRRMTRALESIQAACWAIVWILVLTLILAMALVVSTPPSSHIH